MDRQPAAQDKSESWRRDCLFAGVMLVICCMFITGLISIPLWLSNQNQKIISANATSTAFAVATQQQHATATAVARLAEQDGYEYVERFDRPSGYWFVGLYEPFGEAQISINDGIYLWDVIDSENSTFSVEFSKKNKIKDFDIYMDSKFVKGSTRNAVCSGFFFRKPSINWSNGVYVFTICNDAHFRVDYYEKDQWQTITFSEYENAIRPLDWNRIEVSARGDDFTFTINNIEVFEMSDDRLKEGSLGIFIDAGKNTSAVIWFDNFGFQSR